MPEMPQPRAYLSVGSNIDPLQHIPAALDALMERVAVLRSSTFYRTAPVGRPDQPPFINGVWEIRADRPPEAMKVDVLRVIENRCKRIRSTDRYAPRTMDLDLVCQDGCRLQTAGLTLPHPDLARPFVGCCVLELRPDLLDDGAPEDVRRLLEVASRHADVGEPMYELTAALRETIGG